MGRLSYELPLKVRAGWREQIKKALAEENGSTDSFKDLAAADADGLADIPWEGSTYEQWLKDQAKH